MAELGPVDLAILFAYAGTLIAMGTYFVRKSRTAEGFMVAGRGIPAWAAGLAIMSAYTSSISYIATPGKAYDENWHPLVFALTLIPVTWLACYFAVRYYRRHGLISVYSFLETRLGGWARFYAALSFVLYMVGRTAVILYLAALLLNTFTPWSIEWVILILGLITVIYTLLGGMEAVIWTDVIQSSIMIAGGLFCAAYLTLEVFSGPEPLIGAAMGSGKFSLGGLDLSLTTRTVWVMIIYGFTENLRNLIADQNYVQKYSSAATEHDAERSVWISASIFIPMTALFLYIGTMLFAYYSGDAHSLGPSVTKGDQVFPYFIATELPTGVRGLIIAAILAAAMSTVDSALNCSATVSLLDFYKRYWRPDLDDRASVFFLRVSTLVWGALGTGFALLMIRAKSALDIWWQISGIFGGGILGLFLLALFSVRLKTWQGICGIVASILVISWGTFVRGELWWQSDIDGILVGAVGTLALMMVTLLLCKINREPQKISEKEV